jgi:hypothetical protein
MQDQIMSEAQDYNLDCQVNSGYARFHSCDCLALHFMNERLRHPDFTRSKIQDIIDNDCIDAPSIAGYSYDKCVSLYSSSDAKILKPLCECYARTFTNTYAKKPNVSGYYEVTVGIQSISECRKKVTSMTPDSVAGESSMPPAP